MKKAVIRSKFLWKQCRAKQGVAATSRRHHVAMSPSHDVGSTMQKSTIQPRRNVTTSRHHHVAMSPRRDVSSKICISSFNVRTARKLGHREAYEERHGFPEPEDPDFERVPGICTAFHFVRYYLGYYDDVFDTRHFVLFFHDVLDLFLGLHQTLSQTMD